MDNKNNVNNTTATGNTTEATTANASVMMPDDELMKMKLAYAQFEAEQRKNRTFGEKVVESLPYVLSGLALAGSGVAIGASLKALDKTSKFIEANTPTTWTPSPDGDLE
ncbi:hypothetical protein [Segatella bryantii]|uniref:hypothetical protein n=1 Tax=Segatella bryantii TaxID=77095 RepID=UPI00242FC21F|nr:hypothetical protein [Segatella bryantii]